MDDKNLNKCPFCNTLYDKKGKHCPNCLYKPPLSADKTLWIIVAVLIPLTLFRLHQDNIFINLNKYFSYKEDVILNNSIPEKNFKAEKTIDSKEGIKIPLRDMEELSYKTKDEILAKRKKYVKNSEIFSKIIKNYEPNPDVYKIEDNLAWISAYEIAKYGREKSKDIGKGPSRHSISINNPEVLISLITPEFATKRNPEQFSEADYFFPEALFYDKDKKLITVYFNITSFYEKNPQFIATALFLDETNARDLGYNWIYGENIKDIRFLKPQNNFSTKPYDIKGYYHKGYSCKKQEGCNNYSPYQEQMVIRVKGSGGSMDIKMWKNKPLSSMQKPDITYRMVFK